MAKPAKPTGATSAKHRTHGDLAGLPDLVRALFDFALTPGQLRRRSTRRPDRMPAGTFSRLAPPPLHRFASRHDRILGSEGRQHGGPVD
jgi:hypothetical protein